VLASLDPDLDERLLGDLPGYTLDLASESLLGEFSSSDICFCFFLGFYLGLNSSIV
jgi:hypothetical protein